MKEGTLFYKFMLTIGMLCMIFSISVFVKTMREILNPTEIMIGVFSIPIYQHPYTLLIPGVLVGMSFFLTVESAFSLYRLRKSGGTGK